MTSLINQVSNALASATNQNSLALVGFQLDFDFALVKVSPPEGYTDFARSLSDQRRVNAEEGTLHRTARKLNALFEEIVPPFPNLSKAYGERASEIAESPLFKTTQSAGPFVEKAGLDGTSIYAAATSGDKAIALHLLACMLARSWTGREAVAIWVQLVDERKKFLEANSDPNQLHGIYARLAAQQEITRDQLAAWDASARAWLNCADEVKKLQQTQLRLIVSNVDMSLTTCGTLYSNVIDTWITAMSSLEKLILGIPQNISSGSILLGLLSWHLYPDLNLVGPTKNIQLHDDLIPHPGVVTLGLQRTDTNNAGVHWSLSLSHLRFYGDPVPVERTVAADKSRLTIQDLHLVTFGSVISSWSYPEMRNIDEVADCFIALGDILRNQSGNADTASNILPDDLHWLDLLIDSAHHLANSTGLEREDAVRLVEHGRRRGRKFLDLGCRDQVPMFGLANPLKFSKLCDDLKEAEGDSRASVSLLRNVAMQCRFNKDECVIQYRDYQSKDSSQEATPQSFSFKKFTPIMPPCRYTTAIPHPVKSNKRDSSGRTVETLGHVHWICREETTESQSLQSFEENRIYNSPEVSAPKDGLILDPFYGDRCYYEKNSIKLFKGLSWFRPPWAFTDTYQWWKKEQGFSLSEVQDVQPINGCRPTRDPLTSAKAMWGTDIDGPYKVSAVILQEDTNKKTHDQIFEDYWGNEKPLIIHGDEENEVGKCTMFRWLAGNQTAALYLTRHSLPIVQTLPLKKLTRLLRSTTINRKKVIAYLSSLSAKGCYAATVHSERIEQKKFFNGLMAVDIITHLCGDWPGAPVSIDVTQKPIGEAKWAKALLSCYKETLYPLPSTNYRAAKFACIAMLESGGQDLDTSLLHSVMAMATGNSIYVAESLLQDPCESDRSGQPGFKGIRRILGNIDRPGIVMLIPPSVPRMREVDFSSWRVVKQGAFDGQPKDYFSKSSLHLSFTEFQMPIAIVPGACDADVILLEAFVSVHEGREWVADLDVLGSLSSGWIRSPAGCQCLERRADSAMGQALTKKIGTHLRSIENWEELLCCQENLLGLETGVVRTQNNWLSRLAAVAICAQKNCSTTVLPSHCICFPCSERLSILYGILFRFVRFFSICGLVDFSVFYRYLYNREHRISKDTLFRNEASKPSAHDSTILRRPSPVIATSIALFVIELSSSATCRGGTRRRRDTTPNHHNPLESSNKVDEVINDRETGDAPLERDNDNPVSCTSTTFSLYTLPIILSTRREVVTLETAEIVSLQQSFSMRLKSESALKLDLLTCTFEQTSRTSESFLDLLFFLHQNHSNKTPVIRFEGLRRREFYERTTGDIEIKKFNG
ncbi:hypothetical protein G7Y89_g6536 [Cudoniella acicularis]|uniref:Uncharacterized protein n=1 Tax=Cudoniella acicularis TaxID=354080 RepID=A0A8H4RMS9_9HELO|nr:hypothetical protein G7Y89_g6536 [Cudoniella acicularis]